MEIMGKNPAIFAGIKAAGAGIVVTSLGGAFTAGGVAMIFFAKSNLTFILGACLAAASGGVTGVADLALIINAAKEISQIKRTANQKLNEVSDPEENIDENHDNSEPEPDPVPREENKASDGHTKTKKDVVVEESSSVSEDEDEEVHSENISYASFAQLDKGAKDYYLASAIKDGDNANIEYDAILDRYYQDSGDNAEMKEYLFAKVEDSAQDGIFLPLMLKRILRSDDLLSRVEMNYLAFKSIFSNGEVLEKLNIKRSELISNLQHATSNRKQEDNNAIFPIASKLIKLLEKADIPEIEKIINETSPDDLMQHPNAYPRLFNLMKKMQSNNETLLLLSFMSKLDDQKYKTIIVALHNKTKLGNLDKADKRLNGAIVETPKFRAFREDNEGLRLDNGISNTSNYSTF